MEFSQEEKYILWLMDCCNNSPGAVWRLLERYSPEGIFRNAKRFRADGRAADFFARMAANAGGDCVEAVAARVCEGFAKCNDVKFFAYNNPAYPARLFEIENRPLGLFVRGALPAEDAPCAAIIGSRRASNYGKKAAADMAQGLAAVGIGVISGLARGIDTRAHEGALAKNGYTAAVLACSVDICYPPENWRLVDNILASGGALISEHFPKTAPLPPYFPARNRIISGLGDILLVIEAAKKSGTNHTVTHAINQGREVFALPGSIYSPASAGTNDMLKSGAHMLTHPNDAIYALYRQQKFAKFFQNTAPVTKLKEFYENDIEKTLAHDQKIVYANINHEGVAADFIARATEMEMGKLLQTLTALELGGHIKKLPGQKYALI